MRKNGIIFLMYLSCCSNAPSKQYFELPILINVSQLSSVQPPPPIISFSPVYVISTTDSVTESSFPKLLDVYKTLYSNKYAQFYDFLFDALNQIIKIDTKNPQAYLYYTHSFLINSNISVQYKKNGIAGLIDKYCINNKGRYTIKEKNLTVDELNSISYYFFINQYMRSDDDNIVTINFRKLAPALNFQ
jgi:hypothetical protein